MAETPNINIQIDQDALREQIEKTIHKAFREASMRLRIAADQLDKNEWADNFFANQEERVKAEYKRGFEEGRAAVKQEGAETDE
jgi:hypothetical protein